MALLNSKQETTPKLFIIAGLLLLGTGMVWGLTGGLQYLVPGFLKQHLSFEKVRPLHVSSVVFWIIFGAMGGVLTYLQQHTGRKIYSQLLTKIQLVIFSLSVITILISYCAGIFGGREYWEFHPLLALPIVAGWILLLINFIKSVGSFRKQPVYVWMWLTGILFFLFTFLESYLWVFPYFRNNVVNDMTVQWKSYGSMVGSWNMLIYGSSIFLMDKISNSKTYSQSGIAFVLYFTGLFNLMFNWGHHIYTLPTHNYIKHISYAVSMTELFILGRIIFKWRSSISTAKKNFHTSAYRFLVAADAWIFLTLLLAIAMSIPGINVYTHGTHITVAHTMGATIGINSFLLLAIAFDILHNSCRSFEPYKKNFSRGYWLANVSLFVFWTSLIGAGIMKAKWQLSTSQIPFSSLMLQLRPFFILFFISGTLLMTGILMVIYPLVKNQLVCYLKKSSKETDQTPYHSSGLIASE
jgi:nitric oxide reductase subunit B